jgi:hypothetical protein
MKLWEILGRARGRKLADTSCLDVSSAVILTFAIFTQERFPKRFRERLDMSSITVNDCLVTRCIRLIVNARLELYPPLVVHEETRVDQQV